MNKVYLYIVSILLILTFTMTIVGVPINYHFCGLTGSKTATILVTPQCACESKTDIQINCHNDGDGIDKCHHHQCEDESHHSEKQEAINNDDCCSDLSEVYSINDDFISNSKNKLIFDFSIIQPLIDTIENSELYKSVKNNIADTQKSIRILARKIILLLLFQTFSSDNPEDSPIN